MIVSNTQVTSYNLCRRQEYYRFGMGIEPKLDQLSFALYRGLIGHAAFEAYYQEMREGSPLATCRMAAENVIIKELSRVVLTSPEDYERINLLNHLIMLINAYAEYYSVEPFKVIEVEKVFTTSIDDELELYYGMKLDLLVEYTKGTYRGDLVLIDHKFVYNFKTQDELDMDGQLPKYINTIKGEGYFISKGIFNQVRHREMKNPSPEDIFKRSVPVQPKPVELEQIWNEQIETARELSLNPRPIVRTLSPVTCRGCYFKRPCKAELLGEDISTMLAVEYQNNTYGYTDLAGEG